MPVHRSHGLWLPAVPILRHDRLAGASAGRFLRSYLSCGSQSGTLFIGYLFSCFCFLFHSLSLPLISVVNQWHCSFLFLNVAIIRSVTDVITASLGKGKGKDIPIRAWTAPNGCSRMRLPDFLDNLRHITRKGGKVVIPNYRPPFSPRRHPWYSFLLEAEPTPEP